MNHDHRLTEAKRRQDERAAELNREFLAHLEEFRRAHPELEPVQKDRVFMGWAIQKLAGLQVLVEDLHGAQGGETDGC
jgi:hypothetical protein